MGGDNPCLDVDSQDLSRNSGESTVQTSIDDMENCLALIKLNNNKKTETTANQNTSSPSSVAVNKRLGRGAVNSGLTCECGVFGAMACGEWPTQRVNNLQSYQNLLRK